MYCSKCGAESADTHTFCRKCGARLRRPAMVNSAVSAPAEATAAGKHPLSDLDISNKTSNAFYSSMSQEYPRADRKLASPGNNARQLPGNGTANGGSQTVYEDEIALRLKSNLASALCYMLGWITGIVFLVMGRDSLVIKFHAWQSIITWGILYLVITVPLIAAEFIVFKNAILAWSLAAIYWVLIALIVLLWIWLMLKTYRDQQYRLPLIGNIAQQLSGSIRR